MSFASLHYTVRMKVWAHNGWYEDKGTWTWNYDKLHPTWQSFKGMLENHISRHPELGENMRINFITDSEGVEVNYIGGDHALASTYDCWLIPPGYSHIILWSIDCWTPPKFIKGMQSGLPRTRCFIYQYTPSYSIFDWVKIWFRKFRTDFNFPQPKVVHESRSGRQTDFLGIVIQSLFDGRTSSKVIG